jgi:hypothetical protein
VLPARVVMECVIKTKASMILQFIDGLRGDLQVTFEEGTSAVWLYDGLKPHVTKLVVCDPRKNKSMREGNQSDKIDARRLADLLRLDHLTPVYHGEHGLRTLKELVRSPRCSGLEILYQRFHRSSQRSRSVRKQQSRTVVDQDLASAFTLLVQM